MIRTSCEEFSIKFNTLPFLLAPQINDCRDSSLHCFQGVFNLFSSSLYHVRSSFHALPFLLRCLFLLFVPKIMQQLHIGYSGRPTHVVTILSEVFLIWCICSSGTCTCVSCSDIIVSNRSSDISNSFTFCASGHLRQALSIISLCQLCVIIFVLLIVFVIALPVAGFIIIALIILTCCQTCLHLSMFKIKFAYKRSIHGSFILFI